MRIGIAADTYKPYISGVTNYISLHKAELEKRGHDVRVFTFKPRWLAVNEPGVVHSAGFRLKMGYSFGFWYSVDALKQIRQMDVLHIHHPFISGQLVLNACAGSGIPLIFTGHTRYDRLVQDYLPWFPSAFSLRLLKLYMPGFCRKMDRVVCNSPASELGLRSCGVDVPLSIIPNGIALDPFRNAPRDPGLRAQLAPGAQTVFLYVGRLAVEKNLPRLLHAFALLLQKNPSACLVLAGEGPYRQKLQAEAAALGIADKVNFLGALEYANLPVYYRCADAFVMPSTSDTHPLTILEVMGAGLPIVAVESPAYADTVKNGANGLVTANTAEAIAAAMAAIAADPMRAVEMGRCSADFAEQFSVEHTAGQLLGLYQSVCEERLAR